MDSIDLPEIPAYPSDSVLAEILAVEVFLFRTIGVAITQALLADETTRDSYFTLVHSVLRAFRSRRTYQPWGDFVEALRSRADPIKGLNRFPPKLIPHTDFKVIRASFQRLAKDASKEGYQACSNDLASKLRRQWDPDVDDSSSIYAPTFSDSDEDEASQRGHDEEGSTDDELEEDEQLEEDQDCPPIRFNQRVLGLINNRPPLSQVLGLSATGISPRPSSRPPAAALPSSRDPVSAPSPSPTPMPAPIVDELMEEGGPDDIDSTAARKRAIGRQQSLPGSGMPYDDEVKAVLERISSCPVLNYFDLWAIRQRLEWTCRCCGKSCYSDPGKTNQLVTHLYRCTRRQDPAARSLPPWTRERKPRKSRAKTHGVPEKALAAFPSASLLPTPLPMSARRAAYLFHIIGSGQSFSTSSTPGIRLLVPDSVSTAIPSTAELEMLRRQQLRRVAAAIDASPGKFSIVFGFNRDPSTQSLLLCAHAAWLDTDLSPKHACLLVQAIPSAAPGFGAAPARAILACLHELGIWSKWSRYVVAAPTEANASVYKALSELCLLPTREDTSAAQPGDGAPSVRFVPCFLSCIDRLLLLSGFTTILYARDVCSIGYGIPTAASFSQATSHLPVSSVTNLDARPSPTAPCVSPSALGINCSSLFAALDNGLDCPPRGLFALSGLPSNLHPAPLDASGRAAKQLLQAVDAIIADARAGMTCAADFGFLANLIAASIRASVDGPIAAPVARLLERVAALRDISRRNPVLSAASYIRSDASPGLDDVRTSLATLIGLHAEMERPDHDSPDPSAHSEPSAASFPPLRALGAEPTSQDRRNVRRRLDDRTTTQLSTPGNTIVDLIVSYGRESPQWRRVQLHPPVLGLGVWAQRRDRFQGLSRSFATLLAVPISSDAVDRTRSTFADLYRIHSEGDTVRLMLLTSIKACLDSGFASEDVMTYEYDVAGNIS
ncbi:hypothetical protein OC842_005945 [Tilletia horrida]|uniref:Uncharacterized protein n=1 Tax=Tilletia horrida TaxID=155126 RepID=A0AAN6JI49_9BASI|nr:hypothetical protein OC842_005945 [Tilletia horrida]